MGGPSTEIIPQLVQNCALLALALLASTRANAISADWVRPLRQLTLGAVFGGVAVVAMVMPVEPSPGVYIDSRSVLLGLAAPFGGALAAATAALLAGLYRVHLGGAGTIAGIALVCGSAAAGIGLCMYLRGRGDKLGWIHLLGLGLVLGLLCDLSLLLVNGAEAVQLMRSLAGPLMVTIPTATLLFGGFFLREGRRQRVEAELADRQRQLQTITANVPGLVFRYRIDEDGALRFSYLSPGVHELLGISVEQAKADSDSFLSAIHPVDLPAFRDAVRRSAEELASWTLDFRVIGSDGRTRWLHGQAIPHALPDGRVDCDGIAMDTTGQHEAEQLLQAMQAEQQRSFDDLEFTKNQLQRQAEQLATLAEDYAVQKAAAEAGSRTKSQFLANMSHELRTPLNAIIGFAEMMEAETLGPLGDRRYVDYASDIGSSGRHLLALINDVLDCSKIEAGRLELEEETLDLPALVASCTRMMTQRAANSGVSMSSRIDERVQGLIGDGRRIKQVLLNLLSNAVKFTPSGGTVKVEADLMPDGACCITVSDTGIGMDEDGVHKAMEVFGQVHNTYTRQEGTGLGLPLAKHLVELHGGTMRLESQAGRGTRVTVLLPASRVIRLAA